MCGEKTPGLSSYPIVPPHSLPRRSHFASLKRLVGCSSSTVASVPAAPVEVGKIMGDDMGVRGTEFPISPFENEFKKEEEGTEV